MSYSEDFNKKARREHAFLSMDGKSALEAGLQLLNNAPPESERTEKKDKKKLSWNDLLGLLRLTVIKLDEFIYKIDIQLVKSYSKLEQLKELKAERIAIDNSLVDFQSEGLPQRDINGNLKDPTLKKAIKRYAREHDIPTELLADDAFVLVIVQDMAKTYPTQSRLDVLLDMEQQKIDMLSTGKNQAEQLREDLYHAENLSPGKVNHVITDATRHMDHIADMINKLDEHIAEVEQARGADIVYENVLSQDGATNNDYSTEDIVIPGSNMHF